MSFSQELYYVSNFFGSHLCAGRNENFHFAFELIQRRRPCSFEERSFFLIRAHHIYMCCMVQGKISAHIHTAARCAIQQQKIQNQPLPRLCRSRSRSLHQPVVLHFMIFIKGAPARVISLKRLEYSNIKAAAALACSPLSLLLQGSKRGKSGGGKDDDVRGARELCLHKASSEILKPAHRKGMDALCGIAAAAARKRERERSDAASALILPALS
jgi:hypothetical protein